MSVHQLNQPVMVDVITLFPDMFQAITEQGVVARAFEFGLVQLTLTNPREFSDNKHKSVDDRPYGGGPGMVMMVPPLAKAIRTARARHTAMGCAPHVVYLSPQGSHLSQSWVRQQLNAIQMPSCIPGGDSTLVASTCRGVPRSLILLCGRYEAIDERLFEMGLVDEEISIGDVVLSGGELAAMTVLDALCRCLPDVLNDQQSALQDSFSPALGGLLDSPHYTRPEVFENFLVPEVLLSGNHAKIESFRRHQSLSATWRKRPDLIEKARQMGALSTSDEKYLQQLIVSAFEARL